MLREIKPGDITTVTMGAHISAQGRFVGMTETGMAKVNVGKKTVEGRLADPNLIVKNPGEVSSLSM